jgi:hypothetical protein
MAMARKIDHRLATDVPLTANELAYLINCLEVADPDGEKARDLYALDEHELYLELKDTWQIFTGRKWHG